MRRSASLKDLASAKAATIAQLRHAIMIQQGQIPADVFKRLFPDACEHECFPCSECGPKGPSAQ